MAIAVTSGGLFASAAPKIAGSKQLELVDEYIVLHSSTSAPTSEAAAPMLDGAAELAPTAPLAAIAAAPVGARAIGSGVAAPNGQAVQPTSAQPDVATQATEPEATTNVAPSPTPETAPAPVATPESAPKPEQAPATQPAPAPAPSAPTTAAPKPPATTTAPSAAIPSGARIPSDWPASKPIPPIPPGCEKPQLEDNGKWNCE